MELTKTHTVKSYEIKFNEYELKDIKRVLERYLCEGRYINPWEYASVTKLTDIITELGVK